MKTCLSISTVILLVLAILATTPSSAWGQYTTDDGQLLQEEGQQQALFDEALAKWTSVTSGFPDNMVDYNFAYFQDDEDLPRFQVTVRNSTDLGFYDAIDPSLRLDEILVFTIDQLMDCISVSLSAPGKSVSVTYDQTYGYPTSWTVDLATTTINGILDSFTFFSALQQELEASRAIWNAQEIDSYDCTMRLVGFLPPTYTMPMLVQVRNGKIVTIFNEETGEMADPSMFNFPTIGQAFDNIENGLNNYVVNAYVAFDSSLGFPSSYTWKGDDIFIADGSTTYHQISNVVAVVGGDISNAGNGTIVVVEETPEEAWAAAKLTWENKHLVNYHFGIFRQCECPFSEPIAVQVSHGEVIQMRTRFGTEVYENATGYSLTIEDVFDLIKNGIDSNSSSVEVTYDEEYGYPNSISLDPNVMIADDEYTLTIDYLAPLTEWQNDLDAAKTTWQEKNLASYNYTYRLSCGECAPEFQMAKLMIQVLDGTRTVVAINDSPVEVPQRSSSLSLTEVPTLERLFEAIQDAIDNNVFRLGVLYDEEYGYPTSIGIDYDEMKMDEELSVSAKLEEVKGGGVVDSDPFSSAPKDAATMGQFGLASMLIWITW